MKLNTFTIAGFQSYGDAQTVVLEDHLTLLAGRNNVGKSALLRALQLLARPQFAPPAGTAATWDWTVEASVLKSYFPVTSDAQGSTNRELVAWLLPNDSASLRLSGEFVVVGERSGAGQLQIRRLSIAGLAVSAEGTPGTSLGWSGGPFANSSTGTGQLETAVRTWSEQITYLGPRQIERGPRQLTRQPELEPDGRNLTGVLMYQMTNKPTTFDHVVEILRRAFPDIVRLSIHQDESQSMGSSLTGEPVLYFSHRVDPVPLQHCGTGIEQMLALATGILSADQPRVFLIDEPQAYLHPHAERSLLGLLEEHPEHQYVVASHSNVLLRARPLTHVRMLHLDKGQTRIVSTPEGEQLLAELEITAADLWLADRLLWVEGPTEEEVLGLLAEHVLEPRFRASVTIRRMPEAASRFATKNQAAAEAAYRFCSETTAAIAPLPVRMLFLFDADEKRPEFRRRIEEASDGRARFLPVREIENLFLDGALLEHALSDLAKELQLDSPIPGSVTQRLMELLAETDNKDLFPEGVAEGQGPKTVVRAARLLDALWWEFARAQYEKVRDGRLLAALALERDETLLSPLSEILETLIR